MSTVKVIRNIALILLLCAMSARKPSVGKVAEYFPCPYETFMWALMMQESSGNPRAVFHEDLGDKPCPYHDNKIGLDSLGLFQVSLQDKGQRYKCNFTDRESVFDPIKNRDCADKILAKLRLEADGDWCQTGGRYFSTLRCPKHWPNSRKLPFEKFKMYAAQRGCVIP